MNQEIKSPFVGGRLQYGVKIALKEYNKIELDLNSLASLHKKVTH
jgi:hypothetical protein